MDSLRGGHPIGVPCWMGFPTRFANLVSRGFDSSGLVFLGSDREDDVCGFRGIPTRSSSARRMGPENGVSGFNGTRPSLRRSWSRSVRLQRCSRMAGSAARRPDAHTLDDARSVSAVRMEAANRASQGRLKARPARADSLARLAFGNSRRRAFRPLSGTYRSVPDHGLRSRRRAPRRPWMIP